MNEFDEHKGKQAAERIDRPPVRSGGVAPKLDRSDSAWIGELLRRRYDATLNEALPESFISLLEELDRKTTDGNRK